MSILFLVLVIALFFIPEIIHMQENLFSGSEKKLHVASVSSYKVAEDRSSAPAEVEKSRELSSLDRILLLVNSGYLESGLSGKKQAREESSRARMNFSLFSNTNSESEVKTQDSAEGGVTWKTLRSGEIVQVLRKARTDIRLLVRDLGQNYYQSRYALLNYQNGIEWLLQGDKSPVPARSALDYLERLDLEVTRAMYREGVDRADYLRWSKISLGPLFEGTRAARLKQEYLTPYNPRITLLKVKVSVGRPHRTREGAVSSSLSVSGLIMGKDTERLVLYRNGRRVRNLGISRRVDDQGKRTFRFYSSTALGLYTIQAVDTTGTLVEKTYRFIPRVLRFRDPSRSGIINLPFTNLMDRNFDIHEVDLRIDRFFRDSIRTISSPSQSQGASGKQGERYQLVGF